MEEILFLLPRDELVFESSSKQAVWKQLSLKNPSKNQSVAFKLKNTLPSWFFVRPPMGVVGPNESVAVDIYLQAYVPYAGQKIPKFLIQAAVATGDLTNLPEFWKRQKAADIWSSKIGCRIVPLKSQVQEFRQEGGGDASYPAQGHEDEEVIESMAKLVKQVCVLKEEVDSLREQSRVFFNMAICVVTIVAAILGAKLIW